MEEKINLVKLLKDCPKGMELDSTMYNSVTLLGVDNGKDVLFPIKVLRPDGCSITLTKYGQYTDGDFAKCVIFPKGKTTWEGFQKPWTIQDAKDGDIVSYGDGWTCIFKCIHEIWYSSYCFITSDGKFHTGYEDHEVDTTINGNVHLATPEQCNLLFQKMKEAGYKWNPKTKILVELPKFKVGDIIRTKKGAATPLSNIIITEVNEYSYNGVIGSTTNPAHINFKYQDQYELVPHKFDISSLKPFDRVLVRDDNRHRWSIQFFERLNNVLKDAFVCMGGYRYHQCIPYEGNEYLLDTANECKEYFRTWEKS